MRRRLLMLSILCACGTEFGLGTVDTKIDVPSNPPDLGAEIIEDVMRQRIPEEIDILWVIDNSNSMLAEQQKLGENFASFMSYYINSGLEWHIGVVSTDMRDNRHQGRLQGAAGFRWVDPTVPDPTGVFSQMALLGRDGSGTEKGLKASMSALSDELLDGANHGFYRPDARLSVIVLSDENDQSEGDPTPAEYVSWLHSLKPDITDITFSAIIALETGCPSNQWGERYEQVVEQTEGAAFSICEDDWTEILEALGIRAAGLQRVFYLSEIPMLDTLTVWIDDDGQRFEFELGTDFVYDEIHNAIEFITYTPRASAEIHAQYALLGSF